MGALEAGLAYCTTELGLEDDELGVRILETPGLLEGEGWEDATYWDGRGGSEGNAEKPRGSD